jgi:hypothetical protein
MEEGRGHELAHAHILVAVITEHGQIIGEGKILVTRGREGGSVPGDPRQEEGKGRQVVSEIRPISNSVDEKRVSPGFGGPWVDPGLRVVPGLRPPLEEPHLSRSLIVFLFTFALGTTPGTLLPREGPSAWFIEVGIYLMSGLISHQRLMAAAFRRSWFRGQADDLPFETAPRQTRLSTKKMTLHLLLRGDRPACLSPRRNARSSSTLICSNLLHLALAVTTQRCRFPHR